MSALKRNRVQHTELLLDPFWIHQAGYSPPPTSMPRCFSQPSLPCFTPWRLTPCDYITARLPCPVALGWKRWQRLEGGQEERPEVPLLSILCPESSGGKGCSPPQNAVPEEALLHAWRSLSRLSGPWSFLLYSEARPEDGFWLQTSLLFCPVPFPTPHFLRIVPAPSLEFT